MDLPDGVQTERGPENEVQDPETRVTGILNRPRTAPPRFRPVDTVKKDPLTILRVRRRERETKYVDNNNWPSDSPAAGVYDIRNTSAKMVMYNNKRPSTSNRLRGYSDQKIPREPSPSRHLPSPDLVHKKNPERHTECTTSVLPPFEYDTRMSWPVRDPSQQEGTGADPNRHMYCHLDPEMLKFLHLHGPVRAKQVLARASPDNLSAEEYRFLQHPQLSNSERRYLSSVASVYSTSKMKTIKQNQYRNLLRKQLRLVPSSSPVKKQGFASASEYEKYMRYLEGPRMTEPGNQGNQGTDKTSKNKKSEPLLSRRRAAQEGKGSKQDTPSGPSPYTEDQTRGVNEPAGGRDTPGGRRKSKSAKRRDPDAPRPRTAPGGAPRGLRQGWGEEDQEARRPTPRKSEFAFLQAVTAEAEADDEEEEEFASSQHAGHISVDSVSETGSSQSALPHPPQTPREGYGRPRSRLGRKKPQHEEIDDDEIPEDADHNQDNSLVVVVENGSIASDSQTREEDNDQTPAGQPDAKAVQTGDEDEPEVHKDVGTSLSDFKAFLASQKKSAEMVETGTSMEDERAVRRERKRRRREQRAKQAEEHRQLTMSAASVNVTVNEGGEQLKVPDDDGTSMVSTETGTSTLMTSETTTSSEQQTSKSDQPDPEPKDTDSVSIQTQTAPLPEPQDTLAEQAEVVYPVMQVSYREPQKEPEMVQDKPETICKVNAETDAVVHHIEGVKEMSEVTEVEPLTASTDSTVVVEELSAPVVVVEGEAVQEQLIPELKLEGEQAVDEQVDKVIELVTPEDDTSAQTQSEGQEKMDESPAVPTPSAPAAAANTDPAPVMNANINASLISLNSDMASPRPIESSRPFSPFQEDPIEVSDTDDMSIDMRFESPDPVDTTEGTDITSPPGPPTPELVKDGDDVQKDLATEAESPRTEPVIQVEVPQQDCVQEPEADVLEQQETVIKVEGKEIDSGEVKQEGGISNVVQVVEPEIVSDKVEKGTEAPAIIVSEQNVEGSVESQVEFEAGGAKAEHHDITFKFATAESQESVTKSEHDTAQAIEEVKREVAEAVEREEEKAESTDANQADSAPAVDSVPKEQPVQNENQDQGDLDVSKGVLTVQDISIASEAANKDVDSEHVEEQKESSGDNVDVVSPVEQVSDSIVDNVEAESPADSAEQKIEKSEEGDDKDESVANVLEAMIVPSAPLAEEVKQVTATEEANVEVGDVKQSDETEVVAEATEKTETIQAEPSEKVKTESDDAPAEAEPQKDVVVKVDVTEQLTGKDGNPHMNFEEQSGKVQEDVVVKVDVTEQLTGKDGNPHMNFEEQSGKAENVTESTNKSEPAETEVKEDTLDQSSAPPMQTPEEVITPVPQIAADDTPETISKNTGEEEVDVPSEVKEDTTEQSSAPPMQTPEEFTAPVPQITVDDTPETISKNTEEAGDEENTQEQLEESKPVEIDTPKFTEVASKEEEEKEQQEIPEPEQQTAADNAKEEKPSAQEEVGVAETDEAAEQQVVSEETSSDVAQEKAAEPVESAEKAENTTKVEDEVANAQQQLAATEEETAKTSDETSPSGEEKTSEATVETTLESQAVEKVEDEVKAEVTDSQTEDSAVESQVEVQEATQSEETEAKEANDEAEGADKTPVEEKSAEQNGDLPAEQKEEAEQSEDIAPKDEGNNEKVEDTENNVPTDNSQAETESQQPESTPEVEEAKEKEETNTGSELKTEQGSESVTKSVVEEPKVEAEESTAHVQQATDENAPSEQAAAERPVAENVVNDDSTKLQEKTAEDQVKAPEVVEEAAAVSNDTVEETPKVQEVHEESSTPSDENKDVDQSESASAAVTSASDEVKTEKTPEIKAEAKDGDQEPQIPESGEIQITQTESDVASETEVKTDTDVAGESVKPSKQEQDTKASEEESHAPLERKVSLIVPDNEALPETFEGEVKTQETTEKSAPSDDTLTVEGPGERTRRPSITVNSPEGEVIEQVLNQSADMTKGDLAANNKEEGQRAVANEPDAATADASQPAQVSGEDQKVNEESPKVESDPSEAAVVNGNVQPSVEMHEDEGLNTAQEPPKEEVSNTPLTNGNIQPTVEMHEDEGLNMANGASQEAAKADVPLVNGNIQPTVEMHEDEGLKPDSPPLTNGNDDDTQQQQADVEEKPHVPIIKSAVSTAQSRGSDLKAKMEGKLNNSNAVAYPGR